MKIFKYLMQNPAFWAFS